MKHPLIWLVVLAVIALNIAGFVFLSTSSSPLTATEERAYALASGITCLGLGAGILVLGIFKFQKRD